MKKQTIKLTENEFYELINESVKKILKEVNVLGKINNFSPGKSYTQINGVYADNQRVINIAKKKLISIISKPFKIRVSASEYNGESWGYFYGETADGWKFEAEDIPLELIIDEYSYEEPESFYSPGDYSDTEGHVEEINIPAEIWFCPPGQTSPKDWQKIQFDKTIKELFSKNAEDDGNLSDALHNKENYERDAETGMYDDYINREIDRLRGEY